MRRQMLHVVPQTLTNKILLLFADATGNRAKKSFKVKFTHQHFGKSVLLSPVCSIVVAERPQSSPDNSENTTAKIASPAKATLAKRHVCI